jgi:hypothetical protein
MFQKIFNQIIKVIDSDKFFVLLLVFILFSMIIDGKTKNGVLAIIPIITIFLMSVFIIITIFVYRFRSVKLFIFILYILLINYLFNGN